MARPQPGRLRQEAATIRNTQELPSGQICHPEQREGSAFALVVAVALVLALDFLVCHSRRESAVGRVTIICCPIETGTR
jgi:hypothetical protein